jgi:hypothetical protein
MFGLISNSYWGRNETGKPASASEPAIRRSSRTAAPQKESTTQKTGKSTESRSAEVKKKLKLPKYVFLCVDIPAADLLPGDGFL